MEANKMGNYFEDFVVGEVVKHCQSKTIFESDNNLFSLLTTKINYCPTRILFLIGNA